MKNRSFFFKNYTAHLILIVCAFLLAGGVFYQQMASYAVENKQAELKLTVSGIAEQTNLLTENYSEDMLQFYYLSIARIAKADDVTVLVTDADGVVEVIVLPDGTVSNARQYIIEEATKRQIEENGEYAAVGSIGILTEASSYAVGTGLYSADGSLNAMVFVATQDSSVAGVIRHSTQTLLLILLITLIVALFLSFVISRHMTRPLALMAAAAKEFAAGNFDVRVSEENHCYEIDELAASFNNMAHDLDQLEELTRGFISNVSHEFKTPMTTIGGFVDGIIDGTIPKENHDKYLHIIAEETNRLSRMVNRMLDAAKIQSGELLLSLAPLDFSEMTSQIILSFEQKIEQRKIEVDCDFTDRLIVMADVDHLYRAVYNLVDNAVKFVENEGELTLRTYEENSFCVFAIKNTGMGISEEDLPHVFDRFYKADRSRSMDKTGAGLGLYIVKNIINLHGGEISVRSGNGETEFSFTLPLAPQENIAKAQLQHPERIESLENSEKSSE